MTVYDDLREVVARQCGPDGLLVPTEAQRVAAALVRARFTPEQASALARTKTTVFIVPLGGAR